MGRWRPFSARGRRGLFRLLATLTQFIRPWVTSLDDKSEQANLGNNIPVGISSFAHENR